MEQDKYIKQFEITNMWGRMDISWTDIRPDVNIIVGINGCGKTTMLNFMADYYIERKQKKSSNTRFCGNEVSSPVNYIRSFDVPGASRSKNDSALLRDLKNVLNQNGRGTSFFDYRMKIINFPDQAERIRSRIDNFFSLVNSLFAETGKEVSIDTRSNSIMFTIANSDAVNGGEKSIITVDMLSSGEKQLMLILTTVFLQEESPCVLLMDEPEISLHISWQDELINVIRRLNPNCQLILTTHSPNIFANGWEDCLVFMSDIEKNI